MQPGVSAEPGPKAEVDEKQVELMMLGLRAEEPETLAGAWAVSVGAGAVVAVVGLALGVWGIVALLTRASGTSGAIGGMMLLALGLCFLGIGGWLIFGVSTTARSAVSGRRERDNRHERNDTAADRDPAGASQLIPRILDERHRVARAPGCARRPQARPPAHSVRDE